MGKYIEQYKQMYYAGDMLYAHLVDIIRLIEETNSQSLLDFGCGIGRHLQMAIEMGMDAYGVDISEEAITYAKLFLEFLFGR